MNNTISAHFLVRVCVNGIVTYLLHSDIVSLHSEKFYLTIRPENKWTRIPYELQTTNPEIFSQVKRFVYVGELEIPRDQLAELNDIVTMLHIVTLQKDIAANITFESTTELLDFYKKAIKTDNQHMRMTCVSQFVKSFGTISIEKLLQFVQNLPYTNLKEIMQDKSIHTGSDSEINLAMMLAKWCEYFNLNSQTCLAVSELKGLIQFELITPSDLLGQIRPLGLLTNAEYVPLLEKIIVQQCQSKDRSNSDFIQFYLCNITEAIPNGYRVVTDEEFLTEKFRIHFFEQAKQGIKSLSQSNNLFAVTNSGKTIVCVESGVLVLSINNRCSYSIKLFENSKSCPNIYLQMYQYSASDGYLCVKI